MKKQMSKKIKMRNPVATPARLKTCAGVMGRKSWKRERKEAKLDLKQYFK